MKRYLMSTRLLDYKNERIRRLIAARGWDKLPEYECIRSIYDFVKDEILFGYNTDDAIPASKVLADGYGQCNTKGILFMALLRACGIPCRIHGFTINKQLQKGAMSGFVYHLAPRDIVHSWVEVCLEDTWYELEAFIIDKEYLDSLKEYTGVCTGPFCGYGVAVKDMGNMQTYFNRNNTYIQSEGINRDFGTFDSPDAFFMKHSQALSPVKKFVFRNIGRHLMNRNVRRIRDGHRGICTGPGCVYSCPIKRLLGK